MLILQNAQKWGEWIWDVYLNNRIFGRRGENDAIRNGQLLRGINKNEWVTSLSFFIQFQMKEHLFPPIPTSHLTQRHLPPNFTPSRKEGEDGEVMIAENLWLIDSEPHTYSLSEIIRNHHKQEYAILPQLLTTAQITQNKRATLRSWIYEAAQSLKMERIAVATANYLIDMYFSRGGIVQLQRLQIFGLAALILANKTHSNQTGFGLLPQPQLLNQFQIKICKVCKFRINPITEVHLLDELIYLWNIFAEKHSDLWKYKCSDKDNIERYKFFSSKPIYEMLDAMFLVVKSLEFPTLDLCLNIFKCFLLMDYKIVSNMPKPIEDEVIINFWCNPQDQPLMGSSFPLIFKEYLSFVAKACAVTQNLHEMLNRNREVKEYVQLFIGLMPSKDLKRQLIKVQCKSGKQSFNKESCKIARKCMALKKNSRKQSIETLQN